jgi:26S proteasome regulatory subunit N2
MFSLTLTPSALIGLNEKLKIPKNFQLKSGIRPSMFAYPEPLQPPKKEENVRAATAVLSTAAKAKASKDKEEKEKELKKSATGTADMDVDDKASVANSVAGTHTAASVAATPGTTVVGSVSVAASDLGSVDMEVDQQFDEATAKEPVKTGEEEKPAPAAEAGASAAASTKKEGEKEEKKEGTEKEAKKEPEPTEEILSNPCRVLPAQKQFISFPKEVDGQPVRYAPIMSKRRVGFLMLSDARPEEPEELFEDGKGAPGTGDPDEKEPECPQPFEWP